MKLCSNSESVNKLYQKDFKRVEIYDEEEECTICPDTPNGYMFQLSIDSFLNSCPKGKLGVFQCSQNDYLPLKKKKDITQCKKQIYQQSLKFLELTLDPANKKKFVSKNVEINFSKTLGCTDLDHEAYRATVNNYLIGLDKNKKDIYIEWLNFSLIKSIKKNCEQI